MSRVPKTKNKCAFLIKKTEYQKREKPKTTKLLRTNSSKTTFEECLTKFKLRLEAKPQDYRHSNKRKKVTK